MGTIIGIDYGAKRIGLATASARQRIAMPWLIIDGQNNPDADAKKICEKIRTAGEKVDYFVVGLPTNMDGTEGPQAQLSRTFGDALAQHSKLQVVYQDERLSSFTAQKLFHPPLKPHARDRKNAKRPKQRKPLDAVAAAVILESHLQKTFHEDSFENC